MARRTGRARRSTGAARWFRVRTSAVNRRAESGVAGRADLKGFTRRDSPPAHAGSRIGERVGSNAGGHSGERERSHVPHSGPSKGVDGVLGALATLVLVLGPEPVRAQTSPTTDSPPPQGYWLVAADGGVFSFAASQFFGSTGAQRLNQPIACMTSTPTGSGYWLVARDGGIFAFGDAGFFGSGATAAGTEPFVGMAATPSGNGYWLVRANGAVVGFGDAAALGQRRR